MPRRATEPGFDFSEARARASSELGDVRACALCGEMQPSLRKLEVAPAPRACPPSERSLHAAGSHCVSCPAMLRAVATRQGKKVAVYSGRVHSSRSMRELRRARVVQQV